MPRIANENRLGQQAGAEAPISEDGGAPVKPAAVTPPVSGDGGSPPAPPAPLAPSTPPAPPAGTGGKRRVKCADLKGKQVIVGKGEIVQIDENGFFEVDAEEAKRLLTIPGYEKA